ncbi:hypothetical protein [Burkholderia cepacia]|uniref:hypothetical protein n=1 Tax=Burkholderia cepacia TaxID=292 RepID=UPI002FE1EFB7
MNVNSAAPLRMYCARSGIVAMLPTRFIGYGPALTGCDRSAADSEIACSRIADRQLARDSAAWRWPARRPDEITESPGIEAVLTKKPSCERTLEILAPSLDAEIAGTPSCGPTGTQRKETQQPPYRRSGDKNKFMQTAGPACD